MSYSKSIGTKYYNQFNNGENFDLNLTDWTYNLVGNVGDRIKVIQQVAVWWISETAPLNPFDIVLSGNTLQRTSGDFIADGFIVGDLITFRDVGGASDIFIDRTITSITATTIDFDGASVGLASFSDAILYGKTILNSLRFKYGLIENNEPTNFVSKIDGVSEQSYSASAITGVATPMASATGVNSWKEVNDSVTIKSLGAPAPQSQNYAQSFEIEHIFTILPYYQDGELSNLQTLTQPLLFTTTNSLKYVFSCDFTTTLSNPNGIKDITVDDVLGSVGWFNESLNGNNNQFIVQTPVYTNQDTLAVESAINAQIKTKVEFYVISNFGSFTANTNVVVGISLLPDLVDYQQNANTVDENFLLDDAYTTVDSAFVDSSIITNYTATLETPSEISVAFDVDYLTVDESRLENHHYVIWVATCDETLSGQNTDRATILIDTQQYLYSTDVENLVWVDDILHFPHNVNDTVDVASFDDYKGWIEDGFEIKVPFELNNDLNAQMKALKVHFSAYNPSTDDRFDLQSYNFNLSSVVTIQQPPLNAYHAFNVLTERNFQLVAGSQFNKAELITLGPGLRGPINVDQYEFKLGIKANFEEWISQPNANTVFYDVNEPQNGLNKKSSRYSLQNGYELVVAVEFDISTVVIQGFRPIKINTNYIFLSQPHQYFDYDLDGNVPPEWTVEFLTFDESGANTSGIIKTSENTTIRATFTPADGTTSLSDPYGIIRLNQEGGNINTIYELSTIRESIVNNPLIPLDGESYTKLTDDGSTVVLECLIDGSLIDGTTNYDISATLRDDANEVGIETELGVLIETELNDIIIIE